MTVYDYLTPGDVDTLDTPAPVGVGPPPLGPVALGCFADMDGEMRIMKEITTEPMMTPEVGKISEWTVAAGTLQFPSCTLLMHDNIQYWLLYTRIYILCTGA